MCRIFVGNLSFGIRDAELRDAFSRHGAVREASVAVDRMSRRSMGYAFVEMPDPDEARRAVEAMHGNELNGRPLEVRVVVP